MSRFLPVLALIIAVGVAVVAVIELDSRSDDDIAAVPTSLPSPSTEPAATDATQPPDDTSEPAPSETDEPEDTPEGTEAPAPRTPTPEPEVTVGPVDTAQGETPHTGAESLPAGLALAVSALGLRAAMGRRSSS